MFDNMDVLIWAEKLTTDKLIELIDELTTYLDEDEKRGLSVYWDGVWETAQSLRPFIENTEVESD